MAKQIQTVGVHTNPGYEVKIGTGILDSCGALLRDVMSPCQICLVTDTNVAPLYMDRVSKSLRSAGFSVTAHVFPAGEKNKNLHTLGEILEALASSHMTRGDCVVALGGGVTGDMAGFAAAVYLRGIRFVQMPTTLLADVDASVGGKTAVDLCAGKNLCGAFWQPSAVLCDTECLKTLPDEILADGVSEAIKTAILSDAEMFSFFENGEVKSNFDDVITRCVRYKAGVVERDETEQGERKLLNLGHTVGHAIEKCSNYKVSHGHAVAAGCAIIARAAVRLGWASSSLSQRICSCLSSNALPISTEFSAEELTAAALSDKKRRGDTVTLVIPEEIGKCVLKNVPVDQLLPIISAGLEV